MIDVYASIKVVFVICLLRLEGLTFALKFDQKVKKGKSKG